MNPRSNHQLHIANEEQWHAALDGCEPETVPPFDARGFANQVRQKFRRRVQQRRWIAGGALSAILLLTVAIRSVRHEAFFAPQAVHPSKIVDTSDLAQLEPSSQRNLVAAEKASSEIAIDELDWVMTQLVNDIKALNDVERAADQRRRMKNAASRLADQIRQQAEISVFSSSTRRDPAAS